MNQTATSSVRVPVSTRPKPISRPRTPLARPSTTGPVSPPPTISLAHSGQELEPALSGSLALPSAGTGP